MPRTSGGQWFFEGPASTRLACSISVRLLLHQLVPLIWSVPISSAPSSLARHLTATERAELHLQKQKPCSIFARCLVESVENCAPSFPTVAACAAANSEMDGDCSCLCSCSRLACFEQVATCSTVKQAGNFAAGPRLECLSIPNSSLTSELDPGQVLKCLAIR